MKCGTIHLRDFPKDKIVIFLRKEFRRKIIDKSIEKFGRREFISKLGLKKLDTPNRWKKGLINRGKGWVTPQGIPLNMIRKMSELLNSRDFTLDNIEKEIIAYKSRGKSLWIRNPKIPINESPELFMIISHMMCDGSSNETSVNYYKNNDKNLIKEFADALKKVFGEIEVSFNKDNVVFPIAVRHILSEFYGISFGTFNAEVPKRLFNLQRECSAGFIRGFADDEGNVDTSCIRLYSFNEKLIRGLRELFLKKFPEIKISEIKSRQKISMNGKKGMEYVFNVKSDGMEHFYNKIGLSHIDKNNRVKFHIKRKHRKWNHRNVMETKTMILKSLSKGPKTIEELYKELMVSRGSVFSHLKGYNQARKKKSKGLLKLGFIKTGKTVKYNSMLWELTKDGYNYLNSLPQ